MIVVYMHAVQIIIIFTDVASLVFSCSGMLATHSSVWMPQAAIS